MCVWCLSLRKTLDLRPKSSISTADGGAASVMSTEHASVSTLFSPDCGINRVSHLEMLMSIALMSLFQTSLKRRWGRNRALLSAASSPYRRIFVIFPSCIQCTCPSQTSCFRSEYRLDNLEQVRPDALLKRLHQMMPRMCLGNMRRLSV